MTKTAAINRRRVLSLVVAAAMVAATVMAMIMPRVATAAPTDGITGSFTVGNANPILTEQATLYDSGHTQTVSSMTPQTEYEIKVSVADAGTIDDLNTVVVYVFYDSDADDTWATNTPTAHTQTCFVMTCAVGGVNGTWTHNPASDTTWDIVEANCDQPTLGDGSGDFYFRFTPGMVATEALDWDVYVVVTDDSSATDDWYDAGDYDMQWYGSIDVNTASVNWESVAAGMNFDDALAKETVSVTYIANGAWDAQVSTEATWNAATLDAGGTPDGNAFSLKAWKADVLGSAQFVTTTASACTIDDTGTQTGESGSTNAANTVYLDLGTPFVDSIYSGTITFTIANGS